MKICPNCAEENPDEADLCHYCWHELPQSINPSLPGKTKRSVWVTGAMWAGVITGLAAIGMVIGYFHSFKEVAGSIAIGALLSFIFLWLICTLIAWRWRKAGKRKILEIVIIISFILLWITLSFVAETLLNPTQKPNAITQVIPTETSTSQPTPTISSICNAWDVITASQVGQILCIYGRVSEFGGTVILFSRNDSQVRIIYRPVGTYLRFRPGDCIVATGSITRENGILMMSTNEIGYCPPGFIP